MTRCLALFAGLLLASSAQADSPAFDGFESKIRPVLIEHCHKCHSLESKMEKGGLRVDSRAALLKGGENGPAIVPGKPAESLLLKAIRQTDANLKMPPKGKLPANVVADFEAWIAAGAAMPEKASTGIDQSAARKHWAFQPLRTSPGATIDQLLADKLKKAGLAFSPPADPRTLVRRLFLDLNGLPPTPDEAAAFEKDPSTDAYAKLIDRLLASPAYGERWGRHWLDVARFADTKDGVLMYGDDRVRPFAYTYRDYVIRAFNEDLPFDQMVRDQLAADRVEPKPAPWRLAALGLLTLGRQFDNNVHDVLDDRIDTVSRAFLGLTVACARCHDHKYDPIPTADYYSLYGVFASTESPLVPPLTDPAAKGPDAFEKAYAAKCREIQDTLDKAFAVLTEAARTRVGDYLVHVVTTKPDPLETTFFFLSLAPDELRPPIVARWRTFLAERSKPDDPVFGPWHDLFALPDEGFGAQVSGVLGRWKTRPVNPLILEALAKSPPAAKLDIARVYGTVLKRAYDESKAAKPDAVRAPLVEIVAGRDGPAYFPKEQTWKYMSRTEKDAFGTKQQELDKLAVKEPNAPPRAMAVVDSAESYAPKIFVRGNPARLGEAVSRQFLSVLAGEGRQAFGNGSGRLDLAKAITNHPLAARVIANRVWMHHFGEPLVDTPNDFGLRSAEPTQLALLDHLAESLIADGWSLKRLHRRILMSSAYRQTSFDRPEVRKLDPDNRLIWRMNRQRLDLEAMRDSMLAVSGRLDPKSFGRPVEIIANEKNGRRTVYGLVDRQGVPGVFRAFDFANPDQSAERRTQTTVPQQALFAMNSPFVHEQAKSLAARCVDGDSTKRLAKLYRQVLLRDPDADEAKSALAFVAAGGKGGSPLGPWEQLAQVLLLTNEFMFVD